MPLIIYKNYQLVKDIIPIAGARRSVAPACLTLILSLPAGSWWRVSSGLLCGLGVYFLYAWRAGRFGTAAEE